mgnify:CR=1 FL=1
MLSVSCCGCKKAVAGQQWRSHQQLLQPAQQMRLLPTQLMWSRSCWRCSTRCVPWCQWCGVLAGHCASAADPGRHGVCVCVCVCSIPTVVVVASLQSTVMRQNDALQWMLKYTDEQVPLAACIHAATVRPASPALCSRLRLQSAWATFSSLLRSSSLVVQFSAANGLYAKVRRGWGRLSADARPALAATLWRALFDLAPVLLRGLEAGGDPELGTKLNTVQRLAMTVASVALFVPKGVDSLVQQVPWRCGLVALWLWLWLWLCCCGCTCVYLLWCVLVCARTRVCVCLCVAL